ncbi:MAG TPA: hypothetical protein VFE32_04065 [Puia sp.]|jgi:hypothetical protein|nr:hypothetical protein [Puia sp.]
MKKATRLLILTAFVFPLFTALRAYAGGPGPGQRINYGERARLGLEPFGIQRTDPFNTQTPGNDGFHSTEPDNNPLHLQDPIGNSRPDIDRNDLFDRSILAGHDRFPDAGHPAWDPSNNGGGTAPIDGGISLLLAAGLGLGIKRARARKQNV